MTAATTGPDGSSARRVAPAGWILPAIVLVGLVAAVWCLGCRSLHLDESVSRAATRSDLGDLWTAIRADGGSMALYYALLWVLKPLGSSETMLRLPSALATVIGLVPFHAVARRTVGRLAPLATLILATSFPMVVYAQEARSYALVTALTIGAWWAVLQIDERVHPRQWVPWVLLGAAAVWAHAFGAIYVIVQGLYLIWPRGGGVPIRRLVAPALAGAALLAPLAWLVTAKGSGQLDWVGPISVRGILETVAIQFQVMNISVSPVVTAALGLAAAALLMASLPALVRHWGSGESGPVFVPWLWFALPTVIMLVASIGQSLLVPRYLLPSLPATALLIAVGVGRLPTRSLASAALVAVLGLSIIRAGQFYGNDHIDFRQVAADLSEQTGPDDLVVFVENYARSPVDHHLDRAGATIAGQPVDGPPTWAEPIYPYPETGTEPVAAGPGTTIWVVDRSPAQTQNRADTLARFEAPLELVDEVSYGDLVIYRYEVP